jgi:hypothetical protein
MGGKASIDCLLLHLTILFFTPRLFSHFIPIMAAHLIHGLSPTTQHDLHVGDEHCWKHQSTNSQEESNLAYE